MNDGPRELSDSAMQRLLAMAGGSLAGEPRDAALSDLPVPARYEVRRELGRGGMGVVYEAFDRQLGRAVALKTLAAGFANEAARRRFVREAQAAAALQHPHIAAIHDATGDYIAMQLVHGGPLAPAGAELRPFVILLRDAALALHHAHEHGIVHRDVKPSNLLVEHDHVFVVDFGLAIALDEAGHASMTSLAGTPAYMAPEQARGEVVDRRCDVYGLGATLHHGLSGQAPFRHRELPALLAAVQHDDPRPSGRDRELDLIAARCMAKDPAERYPDARAVADELDRWLQDLPVLAVAPGPWQRWRKYRRRHRRALRAALLAAAAAMLLVAAVLVPITLQESAARRAADEAVALADRAAAVLQEVAAFQRLGDLGSAHRALDDAIAQGRAFLQRHDVPRARYLLCRLLRARGMTQQALDELAVLLVDAPDFAEARFERGLLFAQRNDLDAAQRDRTIADLEVPLGATAPVTALDRLFAAAEALRLRGDHDGAMARLQEVLANDPTHLPARLSLSRAALALGQDDLARYYAASAFDLQQGFGPAYLARDRQLLPTAMLGLDGALCDFAGELADQPDMALAAAGRSIVQLRRGMRLLTNREPVAAEQALRAAMADLDLTLQLHPDLAGARNNRAVVALQLARSLPPEATERQQLRDAALADLAAVLQREPPLPEALYNRGVVRHELAQQPPRQPPGGPPPDPARLTGDAIADWQRALEVSGPDWVHRARCAARLAAVGTGGSGR